MPLLSLEERFKREFDALFRNENTITLEFSQMDVWVVFGQLQLALRHPKNTGPTAAWASAIARALQPLVAPPGTAMAELAERGWSSEADE